MRRPAQHAERHVNQRFIPRLSWWSASPSESACRKHMDELLENRLGGRRAAIVDDIKERCRQSPVSMHCTLVNTYDTAEQPRKNCMRLRILCPSGAVFSYKSPKPNQRAIYQASNDKRKVEIVGCTTFLDDIQECGDVLTAAPSGGRFSAQLMLKFWRKSYTIKTKMLIRESFSVCFMFARNKQQY